MALNQEIHDLKKELQELHKLEVQLAQEVKAVRNTHGRERRKIERKLKAVQHEESRLKTLMRQDIRQERKVTKSVKDKARAFHEWHMPRP
ncbi:MAG TPA: hypothetical protein VJA40_02555 [archaeon]|nr:hypothetical protein [archaeon]